MQSSISGHQLQEDKWKKKDRRRILLAFWQIYEGAYLSRGTRVKMFHSEWERKNVLVYSQVTNFLHFIWGDFFKGCWRSKSLFLLMGGYCYFSEECERSESTGAKFAWHLRFRAYGLMFVYTNANLAIRL